MIDMHAETTSEKMAMGHFVDGRASLVAGTHTHVPTADGQILLHGTGYISDAGMTGDYNSVIGMDKEEPLRRFTRKTPGARYEPAQGEATLCGVAVEIGAGYCEKDCPGAPWRRLSQAWPEFWGRRECRIRSPNAVDLGSGTRNFCVHWKSALMRR